MPDSTQHKCLPGKQELRSHPPKDIFHALTFQEGCYEAGLSCLFIHYSHAHSRNIYFQHKQGESCFCITGCVHPSGRDECVLMAGHSLSCSSDTTEIASRSSHQYAQGMFIWPPETILVARRQFLGRKRTEQAIPLG